MQPSHSFIIVAMSRRTTGGASFLNIYGSLCSRLQPMKIFHPLMNFLSQANEDPIKAIKKKKIYIYIYTHTHTHTLLSLLVLLLTPKERQNKI